MKFIRNLLTIALSISSCATQAPVEIRQSPPQNPIIKEVQDDTNRFLGSTVRWGGIIAKVENKASNTWIEIISRELKKDGQPIKDSRSDGRFIANYSGFIDPLVFTEGRKITIVGAIEGKLIQPVGEFAYTYPMINVTTFYLWPEEPAISPYDPPPPRWYYDPWPYYHPYHYPYPPYYW